MPQCYEFHECTLRDLTDLRAPSESIWAVKQLLTSVSVYWCPLRAQMEEPQGPGPLPRGTLMAFDGGSLGNSPLLRPSVSDQRVSPCPINASPSMRQSSISQLRLEIPIESLPLTKAFFLAPVYIDEE
ncbi:hypothetical protein NDU88_006522 [Pleurodeles waltl]|uniref:Uncharacterized protein n=1 Tax=Pleurodeles waltl TaxID=8319 RepID=A0AAV7NTI9_PLEWA|nr:hypothetical protein NDU88_006522 [Pleurodeles waltl]